MNTELKELFLNLVRLGIGAEAEVVVPEGVDWLALQTLAEKQGLSAVVLDGIDKISPEHRPQKKDINQWINITADQETQYAIQQKAALEMALLLHSKGIRTFVLKGEVVAECYPSPEHRLSVDMDCFLTEEGGDADVWEKANLVMEKQGFEVHRDFYKNSTFGLPGLSVENHRFLTPWRGNKRLKRFEQYLQKRLKETGTQESPDYFPYTYLCRPPVMVSALFLIEHAYSHFLHEGLTWRMVLDWMLFFRRHRDEIDWRELEGCVDEFGFRRFYDSFCRLGRFLLGELAADSLQPSDRMMLEDVWAELDTHDTVTGFRGKLALAGNTWRARWKYKQFTDMSWVRALWIQVKGVLFEMAPKLS